MLTLIRMLILILTLTPTLTLTLGVIAGMVIANDPNAKRCQILYKRCQLSRSSSILVTNTTAEAPTSLFSHTMN